MYRQSITNALSRYALIDLIRHAIEPFLLPEKNGNVQLMWHTSQ